MSKFVADIDFSSKNIVTIKHLLYNNFVKQ